MLISISVGVMSYSPFIFTCLQPVIDLDYEAKLIKSNPSWAKVQVKEYLNRNNSSFSEMEYRYL